MRLLLVIFPSLLVTTLAIPNPATILSSSNCNYIESTDTIDCSAVINTDEITEAMGELGAAGQTKITGFLLASNYHLAHLPQGMLGKVQFEQITITDNPNLSSCGDILGDSQNSVLHLDLSGNKLAYLPRMESTSLTTYKQNGPYLASIASNALNAVPNLQVIELQETGLAGAGLVIGDGTFTHLPVLQELNMMNYKAKDMLATKGSFTFNSPHLHTVDLRSSVPVYKAEVGTFGGFNANATLSVKLNAVIEIESFYNVFKSGAHVVVQELQPCQCNLDWLKSSCFMPQATMRCVYFGHYWDFADLPPEAFSSCCFGPTST